jgi:hypothetical protein
MVLVTVFVGITAEFLVDSINGMVEANPSLSAEWVGLILLPIVSLPQLSCWREVDLHRRRSVMLRNISQQCRYQSRTSWIYQSLLL